MQGPKQTAEPAWRVTPNRATSRPSQEVLSACLQAPASLGTPSSRESAATCPRRRQHGRLAGRAQSCVLWLWLSLDCASVWAGYLPGPHAKAAKPVPVLPHTVASSVTKYNARTEHRSQRLRGQAPRGYKSHLPTLQPFRHLPPYLCPTPQKLTKTSPHVHTSHCPTDGKATVIPLRAASLLA